MVCTRFIRLRGEICDRSCVKAKIIGHFVWFSKQVWERLGIFEWDQLEKFTMDIWMWGSSCVLGIWQRNHELVWKMEMVKFLWFSKVGEWSSGFWWSIRVGIGLTQHMGWGQMDNGGIRSCFEADGILGDL